MPTVRSVVAAAVLLSAVAGCAPAAGKSEAAAAATRFAAALTHKDGGGACAMLSQAARSSVETSSREECQRAILDVRSSTGATEVSLWGDEAQVRIGTDTIFLDSTTSGWRVRAAGCKPQGNNRP